MCRFKIGRLYRRFVLNLYNSVCHTYGQSIKKTVGVVASRLVGMGLKKLKRGYRPVLGVKRCRSKRTIKKRIDPRVSWPRILDFQERFRLSPACVEELIREFKLSQFRPGKGEDEKRDSPIPLFHKVTFFTSKSLLSLLITFYT